MITRPELERIAVAARATSGLTGRALVVDGELALQLRTCSVSARLKLKHNAWTFQLERQSWVGLEQAEAYQNELDTILEFIRVECSELKGT